MAFPLTPAANEYHTEAGLRYKWTGVSWDLLDSSSDNQVLITSTTDPVNGLDTAPHIGTIWRNTSTGKAFRYETLPGPSPLVVDLSGSPSITGHSPYPRQSVTFEGTTLVSTYGVTFFVTVGSSFDATLKVFTGESSSGLFSSGESLFGAPLFTSTTQSISHSGGASDEDTFVDFNVGQSFPNGVHSFIIELTNTVPADQPQVRSDTNSPYPGGFFGATSWDIAFKMTGTQIGDGYEWNPVKAAPSFMAQSAPPNTRDSGDPLKEGDIWIDSTTSSIYYRSPASTWIPIKAVYDNTLVNVLTSTNTQGAIEEIDAIYDVVEGGSRFIGTYAPSTNTADFLASTGYTDGVLPSANLLYASDFLVVTEEGIGQAPAPAVQMYKGDYLFDWKDTNTWVHYQFGSSAPSFLSLSDTPGSYSGQSGQIVQVNSPESGLEFASPLAADNHSFYIIAGGPTVFKDSDIWIDETALTESVGTAGVWKYTSPVAVTSTTPPTGVSDGSLWYDRDSSTLYIYDVSINPPSWVAV